MKQTEVVKHACQILRRRVRFDGAHISLPDTPHPKHDTEAIQDATRIYVESWIVPIINAIERGDTYDLRVLTERERGAELGSFSPAVKRVVKSQE